MNIVLLPTSLLNLKPLLLLAESIVAYEAALKLADEVSGDAALANLFRSLQVHLSIHPSSDLTESE